MGSNFSENSPNKNPSNKVEKEEEEEDGDDNHKNGGSSSTSTVEESERKTTSSGGPGIRQYVRSKTPRLRWTPDLHHRFVRAVERLGGHDRATPKLVLQLMNVRGLSIPHVKSHLQMYRSKKIDDSGRVISDQRRMMGVVNQNPYNFCQLPMLSGIHHQTAPSTNPRYDWGGHGYWGIIDPCNRGAISRSIMSSSGYYSSPMETTIRESRSSTAHDQVKSQVDQRLKEFQLIHENKLLKTQQVSSREMNNPCCPITRQLHESRKEQDNQWRDTCCSLDTDRRRAMPFASHPEQRAISQKDDDGEPDLNLSLSITPRCEKRQRDHNWEEDHEVDQSKLFLSLFSHSNKAAKFSRLEKKKDAGDHEEQAIGEASTLDLTI